MKLRLASTSACWDHHWNLIAADWLEILWIINKNWLVQPCYQPTTTRSQKCYVQSALLNWFLKFCSQSSANLSLLDYADSLVQFSLLNTDFWHFNSPVSAISARILLASEATGQTARRTARREMSSVTQCDYTAGIKARPSLASSEWWRDYQWWSAFCFRDGGWNLTKQANQQRNILFTETVNNAMNILKRL